MNWKKMSRNCLKLSNTRPETRCQRKFSSIIRTAFRVWENSHAFIIVMVTSVFIEVKHFSPLCMITVPCTKCPEMSVITDINKMWISE